MSEKAEKGIPIDFHPLGFRIVALAALRALGSWTEVSPNASKLARLCIQTAATRRVQLNAPAGSRESARVFGRTSQRALDRTLGRAEDIPA